MKRKSISAKILLTTMLVVVVLAVSLALVMTYFMRSMTDATLLNMLQPMAKTAAQSVEGNLHTLTDRLYLIRDNQMLGDVGESMDDLQQALDRATSGIEFVWLGVYDTSGAMLTGSEGCPLSIAGRQLYDLIRETENLVIEDTTVGNSGLEIVIGVPAWSAGSYKSDVEFYLVGSYKYDLINDVLTNINIGTHGTAFIIDEMGSVIAHKDRGMVYSQASITQSLGDSPEAVALLDSMLQGQTGSVRFSIDGDPMFVSYAPIRGTRWSLGIQVPRSDYMSPLNQAVTISVVVTVLLLAVVAAVQSLFTKRILSDPLHAITSSAKQLAMGEYESDLPQKVLARPDEIGQLANAFSTMTASVQTVNQEIGQLTSAIRVGALNQRAELEGHQGNYRRIISGINDTLDVISSHLDAMPGAFAMFNEAQRPIYINRTMLQLSELHGIGPGCICMLASFVSSGEEYILSDEVAELFAPDCPVGTTYHIDSALTDRYNNVYNYHLTLLRTGLPNPEEEQEDGVCVMLIASDVTQLTRAKMDAEAASHAKSDFLSRMSHEMRTPMNAIIGMTAIAKATEDVERKEYCLDRISEASTHLLGVINDILDMSKIEADKFELSPAEFAFEKMLQRVTSVNNFRIEEKNQNLLVEIDREIPAILVADEQRLSQVLTNLLSNAVKFTPEGGTITMRAKHLESDDQLCALQVEVQDTGIGISEEQMGRLFTSFEQADGSISRKFGGTGLGLAISKRIIQMMGGAIWVESEVDHGSRFIFEITVPIGSRQPDPPLLDEQSWHGLRVLAVDDAPEILELFQLMLSPYGVHCDIAASGADALELLERSGDQPYDIVFADWKMPEMNGIELTRAVVEMPLNTKPVVVLITAADWSEIADVAKQAGVSRFLQKPLFPSMLVDCINQCLTPQQMEKMENAAEAEGSSDNIFEGKHVLLAEDVDINREILMALIEHTGVEMEFAVDGEQAVAKFTADPGRFDMILMDVHMPNVDGYEATRRIRASELPDAATIPIIAMTANVFREDIEHCLESGMNGHLGKPIDPAEVIQTMRHYLLNEPDSRP